MSFLQAASATDVHEGTLNLLEQIYSVAEKCLTRRKAHIFPHSFPETEKKSYFVSQLRLHTKGVKKKKRAAYTHAHTYGTQTGSLTDEVGENRCGQVQ